ncbi:MAG: tRNA (adenosine(37)-N6)-threonylcarbamoyltransferase complex dimerization subunit type 1 TsaB [Candidatus Omnitrophica bacterium]|nr:tRNA (adenosine(37)-N6)-threonylcarbamoyltransferase complex dimerization subunit type 1 TsaB [Candidatus Omnitrophota bacterium]
MNLLAIDTSTDHLGLAVLRGDKVAARFHRKVGRYHSRLLVPMIDKVLKKARLKIKDVDALCVSIGPGSFTGLRIGVAVAKGLAYALKKKIVTVPTLDAIAYNAKAGSGVVCPVLDARKNKVYAALYRCDGKKLKRISKHMLIPAKDLLKRAARYKDVFFLGDALALIGMEKIKAPDWHPRPEIIATLGRERYLRKEFVSAEDLEPLYLYSSECDITGK